MATDYAEKERVFIASLEADTGQALDAWMRAIADSGFTARNDIIDWLRQEGFTFSNASWLERIHHNGGRLIYADDVPAPMSPAPPRAQPTRTETKIASPTVTTASPAMPAETEAATVADVPLPIAPTPPQAPAISLDPAVVTLLAEAKGLRPLATLAIQNIAAALPGTAVFANGPLIIFAAAEPFLALLPGAKALRFYGDFGPAKHERVSRAEAAMKIASKDPPPYASVVVLSDARLVDDVFRDLVQLAYASVHPERRSARI
jgi:hypothetical protein